VTSIDGKASFERGVAGGLTIVAWFHGGVLIARVMKTPNVVAEVPSTTMVTSERELHELLDAWLADIKQYGVGDA
jgi:hypothetical protein